MAPQPTNFDAELGHLTDDARRAEARDARRRRSDRSVAAGLSASFAGTLVELQEIRSPVTVLTRSGANLRGVVAEVGSELVILETSASTRVLVRTVAIEAIRESGAGHDRDAGPLADGPDLVHELDALATDGRRASLTLLSGNKLMGVIERVGVDQLVLRLDGDIDVMTIPISAVDHVVVDR